MGRKQRDRLCCSMKLMALLPVLIVLAPASLFLPETYVAIARALTKVLGVNHNIVAADVVFVNATIWTGESRQPWAQFMAVDGHGRVLAIGHRNQTQFAGVDSKTRIVDLEGKFVVPGFIDSHVHFLSGGLQMMYVQLGNVRSRADFWSTFKCAAREVEKGKWIIGVNWNQENWGGDMPHSSWIEAPDHPVVACRIDFHKCLVNSVALALADIHRDTPDPEGGMILRDSQGDATGLLVDTALTIVQRIIPKPSIEERRAALIKASKLALSNGITSVVDFGRTSPQGPPEPPWDDFKDVYLWADATGNMRVRVSAFFPLEIWPNIASYVQQSGCSVSQWLRVGGVKAFADGSLGSRSALFHQAYADNSDNFGLHVADPNWLLEGVLGADKAGLQVAIHAIGDAANDQVLSIFEGVESKNGPRDRRFRMEHAQHLSADAPKRFGKNGVIASMQPAMMQDDALYAARTLGQERAEQSSYLLKSILGNGTQLALGSDWPVSPLVPLLGIEVATKRIPHGKTSAWVAEESISLEAALRGYTRGSAYASFWDDQIGSLSPTKFADFVVLSLNPFLDQESTSPSVLATYVAGVLAHPVN